jgi:hypothetical protein
VLTVVPRYAAYEGVEATGISVPLHLPLRAEQQVGAAGEAGDAEMGEAQQAERVEAGAGATSSGGEQEAGASDGAAPTSLRRHAYLWQCQQGGVQRIFVDHPLFTSSGGCWWVVNACAAACAPPVLPAAALAAAPICAAAFTGAHSGAAQATTGC